MLKNFAMAAAVGAALFVGGSAIGRLLGDDLEGCAHDPDGGVYTIADNGDVRPTQGWTLSDDASKCFFEDSVEPRELPVLGVVNDERVLERFKPAQP